MKFPTLNSTKTTTNREDRLTTRQTEHTSVLSPLKTSGLGVTLRTTRSFSRTVATLLLGTLRASRGTTVLLTVVPPVALEVMTLLTTLALNPLGAPEWPPTAAQDTTFVALLLTLGRTLTLALTLVVTKKPLTRSPNLR